ncbi:SDR family NAD(P)-dependent oxidoreductase [Kordiimonas pumila]|uniref:SDR family NAD(P)-dependent oxidoreductase n=1 Tax=Kordiimonas pumila TaxID=2161677 RepID=A0ABV7D6M7_9PROT|nr:glucose 1-dehydrogenase [Kordiimonas pumila]
MQNTLDLAGKVALVTGASTGIGRATAKAFARDGATVVLADINEKDAGDLLQELDKSGATACFIKTDVASPSDVEALTAEIINRYGKLDCAFNNAGIAGPMGQMLDGYTLEDWDRVFSINIRGVMLCMQQQIRQMLKQGSGTIVNTASIWGFVGAMGCSAYVASKHAVVGLTKATAIEYAPKGIRVNCVSPGTIRTPIIKPAIDAFDNFEENMIAAHPIGRLGEPIEVGEAVVWLSKPASSFVVGQNLPVDGGFTLQ